MRKRAVLGRKLLDWFARNQRRLPWRETPEPYRVWISEMMLQQTRVDTVIPYFERWVSRFPDLPSLARADEDEVLRLWQGLGYYSRARSLRRAAVELTRAGRENLPSTVPELKMLPGIGRYTAGAIASIAFGEREPVVDGNVIRVLTRLLAIDGNPLREPLKSFLWRLAEALLVSERPGDSNQALMELGAVCCTPKAPACHVCPWSKECCAHRANNPLGYPQLPLRAAPTQVRNAAALVRRGSRVLVVQLPRDAPRWASLWLFPSVELEVGETSADAACRAVQRWAGLSAEHVRFRSELMHSVTRYRIQLRFHEIEVGRGNARPSAGAKTAWKRPAELESLAMPAPHRKLARSLLRKHG